MSQFMDIYFDDSEPVSLIFRVVKHFHHDASLTQYICEQQEFPSQDLLLWVSCTGGVIYSQHCLSKPLVAVT